MDATVKIITEEDLSTMQDTELLACYAAALNELYLVEVTLIKLKKEMRNRGAIK